MRVRAENAEANTSSPLNPPRLWPSNASAMQKNKDRGKHFPKYVSTPRQ